MKFYALVLFAGVLDVIWWIEARRLLRRAAAARAWKWFYAAFMIFQVAGYFIVVAARGSHHEIPLPGWLVMLLYIWHMFIQPVGVLIWLLTVSTISLQRLLSKALRRPAQIKVESSGPFDSTQGRPSRRDLLFAGAMSAAPLAATAGIGGAVWQLRQFEIARMDVPVPGLPPALEGLRIAHVTDTHIGKFTTAAKLRDIVEAVNNLDADLVAFTGDLIDVSLNDLDQGIDMVAKFKSRYGTYLCEGNHDLMENRSQFERLAGRAGFQALFNQAADLKIRGQNVQMLGIRWGGKHLSDGAMLMEHVAETATHRRKDAFPILLAHHPHAFDPARNSGFPLVLSGHTHGGQINFTKHFGLVQLMYKYWTGMYFQPESTLVVSNGAGSWFPLRINAPAQIGCLTLRAKSTGAGV